MKCSECWKRCECDYYKANPLCADNDLIFKCDCYLNNNHYSDNTECYEVVLSSNGTVKSIEKFIFSSRDVAGNMKPLNQIFDELGEKMSQFSTQEGGDDD